MIRLAARLHAFPADDPAAVRLAATYAAYGAKQPFLPFWRQTVGGRTSALLCRMDDVVTLWSDRPRANELAAFLAATAPGDIFCTAQTARTLDFPIRQVFCAFRLSTADLAPQKTDDVPDFAALYRALQAAGGFALPPFEIWYPDVSHRFRHGALCAVARPEGCALALTAPNAALLTGIAVRQDARGKGHGRELLEELCRRVAPLPLLLCCAPAVAGFYRAAGAQALPEVCLCRAGNRNASDESKPFEGMEQYGFF